MLPTVVLTAESAIRSVPKITRDAAYGMGCTRSQVIWKVMLPTAMPGILTGVMLAVARAAGETAPLSMTDGADARYVAFSSGVDPGDPVDRAIMRTRSAVFPAHVLLPQLSSPGGPR
jgi:phosphate transport system permease protein